MGSPILDGVPVGPTYYVNGTTGSDVAAGTRAAPWRTLNGARLNVRGLTAITRQAPLSVLVDPGDFWLTPGTNGLNFDPGDSGLGWPVRGGVTGAAGSVKVYGGQVIDPASWVLVSGSIYRTRISARVTTLWENGVRARCARTPAYVAQGSFPVAQGPYFSAATMAPGSQTVFAYTPGDLTSPISYDYNSVRVAIWSGGARCWFKDVLPLASVNPSLHQITTQAASIYQMLAGSRYYLDGDLSFLVGPGQFYCDLTNGWLYYWPTTAPIASQQIVIPACTNAINFQGTSASVPTKNITIDGWDIQYSDAPFTIQNGVNYSDRDMATVRLHNTLNVGITRCNIHNSGEKGLHVFSANRRLTLANSWIHDNGGWGARWENHPANAPDIGDVNNCHTIRNIKANDNGQIAQGDCLMFSNIGSVDLDHAELYNSERAALQYNAGGDLPTPASNFAGYSRFQRIKAYNLAQGSGDIGGLYTEGTYGAAAPLIWNQCTLDNVAAEPSMNDPFAPAGVMLDDNTGAAVTLSNINVTNTGTQARFNSGTRTESNVSWAAGFDPTKMDPGIGLTGGFPY